MSVILITSHNECIYDINSQKEQPSEKPRRHKKSHSADLTKNSNLLLTRARLIKDMAKEKKPHGIMGLPRQPMKKPEDFLRKGGKPSFHSDGKYEKRAKHLPPIPKTKEVLRETTEKLKHVEKDHLRNNVKKADAMVAKEPKKMLYSDGMERKHITREQFGKVPLYLGNMIKSKQSSVERKKEVLSTNQPKCVYITRDERAELLEGLKQNWEELQSLYQKLPVKTDTVPKKTRKVKLEDDLRQLERDIALIERHPYIYVYDDETDL